MGVLSISQRFEDNRGDFIFTKRAKVRATYLLALVLTITSATAFGQAAGGTSAVKGTTPEEISGVGGSANINGRLDQSRSGDYLLGTVTVEGNPLIWEPIPVTVYCDGKNTAQVYADGKGKFKFVSTRMEGSTPINSKDIKLTAEYVGCVVRAALAGYRSSSLIIANGNMQDDPNIGTVKLMRDEHANGTAVSETSATAPKNALKEFEKARDDYMDKKLDKAENDLKKAVEIDPQFAAAWFQLGKLQRKANSGEAMESFSKAVAADPKYVPPYEQLAELNAMAGKWQDVENQTEHSLKLDAAGSAQIWYYNALAKFNLGQRKEAEESAKKALAMDPNHSAPNTEQLLAVLEAGRGDYNDALQHLKHCLTYLPAGSNADLVKQQISQVEPQVSSPAK
jgi:tetratricopeptide (TPR) repeat protein